MARPTKSETERRSCEVRIYLTPSERERVEARAAKAGKQLAAYARETLLTGKMEVRQIVAPSPELMEGLARIGNNLNQIAHHLNMDQHPNAAFHREQMDAFHELMARLEERYGS